MSTFKAIEFDFTFAVETPEGRIASGPRFSTLGHAQKEADRLNALWNVSAEAQRQAEAAAWRQMQADVEALVGADADYVWWLAQRLHKDQGYSVLTAFRMALCSLESLKEQMQNG